jgi:hypothetical protein
MGIHSNGRLRVLATAMNFPPSLIFASMAELTSVEPFMGITSNGRLRVLATAIHFHPSIIIVDKGMSHKLERGPIKGPTLVGSGLAHKILDKGVGEWQ